MRENGKVGWVSTVRSWWLIVRMRRKYRPAFRQSERGHGGVCAILCVSWLLPIKLSCTRCARSTLTPWHEAASVHVYIVSLCTNIRSVRISIYIYMYVSCTRTHLFPARLALYLYIPLLPDTASKHVNNPLSPRMLHTLQCVYSASAHMFATHLTDAFLRNEFRSFHLFL